MSLWRNSKRTQRPSGMRRSSEADKPQYGAVYNGPMLHRWAMVLTDGVAKYPNDPDGTPNWMLANSKEDYQRFRASAARHFARWMQGHEDEDHAAAVFFNINGAEYVKSKLAPFFLAK